MWHNPFIKSFSDVNQISTLGLYFDKYGSHFKNSPMKIAIVTRSDPEKMASWSGTPFFIINELRKSGHDLHMVHTRDYYPLQIFIKVIKNLCWLFLRCNIDLSLTPTYSKYVSKNLDKRLDAIGPHAVIGIVASSELASLSTELPIIHISDATYMVLSDYYPKRSFVPAWLRTKGNILESNVLERSELAIFPSDWARDSAIGHYGTEPEKTKIIKFGANVRELPILTEDYYRKKFENGCRLLFVGKEWQRKGGDIALSAFQILQSSGMKITMDIVGCDPFASSPPNGITIHKNIQKNDPSQFSLFNQLFADASFFILPTRAEAFGLVFAEAAAFATPVLATNTGGIGSVVEDNKTGILLPLKAGGEEFAQEISKLWGDKKSLIRMGTAAREKYDNELNWDSWQKSFSAALEEVIE
ncbi:glycosyltransferase family 4 protein [Sneathiella marina]|uniref:Glycosyltransferase family 4 protein n=1 Tax=Sneathiella marina TaxID=2950108 RepID=A0ABY4W720_9PROT|nr:glycosyltransferase family 4 protein [Sneathiella marina]USG62812.1 glycosyltransferase family 4 protein [Sneathiella marina]